MTELPYERHAMNGDPIPDGLTQEDQLMYLSLRSLYALYHRKDINRDQAAVEKKKLLYEYDKRIRAARFNRELTVQSVTMWKEIGRYLNQYRKERSLESADKLVDAMDGRSFVFEDSETQR